MDSFALIGGGVLLLLAAAMSPLAAFSKISRHFGTGVSSTAPGTMSGATLDNVDLSGLADFQQNQWPKDRRLTEQEVKQLARHIISTYGLNAGQKQLLTLSFIESSWRPWVTRDEPQINDKSIGLMQTLLLTAQDLYSKGYTAPGQPTEARLKDPFVSMYYGAAYIDWLKKGWPDKGDEWYVRAYNGGPGWERTPRGPAMTQAYFDKYVREIRKFSISIRTGN